MAVATAVASAVSVAGAAAFACIAPATLNLSTASGRPGDVITVKGQSWQAPGPNGGAPVRIHWHSVQGQLLGQATVDQQGTFETTITVPDGAPGFYAITGVQRDEQGADAPGTPSRALFEIRNPTAAPAPDPASSTFTPTAEPQGSSFPLALVTGLGSVGLVLFAGGFIAVTRSRRGGSAAPARVRP